MIWKNKSGYTLCTICFFVLITTQQYLIASHQNKNLTKEEKRTFSRNLNKKQENKVEKAIMLIKDYFSLNATKSAKSNCAYLRFIEEQWIQAKKLISENKDKAAAKIVKRYIANQTKAPFVKYASCCWLAQYYLKKESYNKALMYLREIRIYAPKKDLTDEIIATANLYAGKIFAKKAIICKNKKQKYRLISAKCYKKARKYSNEILKTKECVKNKETIFIKEAISHATLQVANYCLRRLYYFYDCTKPESMEKLRRRSERYYKELITNTSTKSTAELAHDKLFSYINLAELYQHPLYNKSFAEMKQLVKIYKHGLQFAKNNLDLLLKKFGPESVAKPLSVIKQNVEKLNNLDEETYQQKLMLILKYR